MNKSSLGAKLRYFRKVRQVSQLDLETAAGLSFGTISRIETDLINPTKETLFSIAQKLKLNKFETDYLIGTTAEPISQSETQQAINSLKEYFDRQDVFAYLVDDRYRMVYVSQGFIELMNFEPADLQKTLGLPLPQIMIDPQYKVFDFINTDDYPSLLRHNLSKYYFEVGFMKDDPSFNIVMEIVKNHPIANQIWQEILQNPPQNVNTLQSREVIFKIGENTVKMDYSAENLSVNPRFVVIEYNS